MNLMVFEDLVSGDVWVSVLAFSIGSKTDMRLASVPGTVCDKHQFQELYIVWIYIVPLLLCLRISLRTGMSLGSDSGLV